MPTAADAQRSWDRLVASHEDLFAEMTPRIVAADVNGHTTWRLRTGDFPAESEAEKFCLRVQAVGATCIVGF